MTEQHPITPPPELRRLWAQQAQRMDPWDSVAWLQHVSTQAARWGADQELEACCEWVRSSVFIDLDGHDALRDARRSKPPSLAAKALIEFKSHQCAMETNGCDTDLLCAALERLQELENNG